MSVGKTLSPEELSEVQEFMEKKADLEAFVANNHDIFHEYRQYAEAYNQTLGAADKAVRSLDVSCGPWDRYSEVTAINFEMIFESEGRDPYLDGGGTIKTVKKYDGDKAKVLRSFATGHFPKALEDEAVKINGRWHAPKKIVAP